MKKSFISACISLGLILPQLAFGDNVDLSKKIDILETEINNMQKSMSNLVDKQQGSNQVKDTSKKAIEDLIDEIKNIQLDIERLEFKIKNFSAQNAEFEQTVNMKLNTLTETVSQGKSGDKTKDTYLLSNIAKEIEASDQFSNLTKNNHDENKAAAEYQKAYVLLKKSNADTAMQDQALEAFLSFIDKFQDSPLRGNAYYWIGSIHSQQKQYNKSAIDFLSGYKANAKSGRAIDNLLGLSDSLIKLNKTKEACSALNKLYNEFPNMNITNKRHADEMFSNASCSNDN
jgi:TolA-binding protein